MKNKELIVAFILMAATAGYLWSTYVSFSSSALKLSNYTGVYVSENLNKTLNNINSSINQKANATVLQVFTSNLPLPDFYNTIGALLLLSTAILALYGLIAIEVYKRRRIPRPTFFTIMDVRVNSDALATSILLSLPILVFLVAILYELQALFLFNVINVLKALLIQAVFLNPTGIYANVIYPLKVFVAKVVESLTLGTQYTLAGILLGIFFSAVVWLASTSRIARAPRRRRRRTVRRRRNR